MKLNYPICNMVLAAMLFSSTGNLCAQALPQTDSTYFFTQSDSLMTRGASGEEAPYIPQIIPPSPQSAIYQKYLDHEISESTGIPDISIPLYEIKLKDMTIPVTLSYHASGVKAIQYDGDVGAGWSINVGGFKVMRTIYGLPDDLYTHYLDYDSYFEGGRTGPANYEDPGLYEDRAERDSRLNKLTHNGTYSLVDSEFDHFSYILPSSSGKFIIENYGQSMDLFQPIIAGPQQDKIELVEGVKYENPYGNNNNTVIDFSITDEQGTIYEFGGDNMREWFDNTEEWYNKSTFTECILGWPLRKMTTLYHEELDFAYSLGYSQNEPIIATNIVHTGKAYDLNPLSGIDSNDSQIGPYLDFTIMTDVKTRFKLS